MFSATQSIELGRFVDTFLVLSTGCTMFHGGGDYPGFKMRDLQTGAESKRTDISNARYLAEVEIGEHVALAISPAK